MNYLFNFFGSVWSAALGILFVPIYLRYIGVEGYGIIGFFTSLQAFLFLLDFGLSPTFNRELARLSTGSAGETARGIRTLTRSLATVNWAVSGIIGLILALLAPIFANYWINASTLSISDVTQSFLIMGVASAFQFPLSFYTGGLAGLQRQVASNLVQIVFGTLRAVGSLAVIALISPTIQAFLLTQAIVTLLQMAVTAALFYNTIPGSESRPVFDRGVIKHVWRFAAGNTGIGLAALAFSQTDKLVLSRLLSLNDFGYYSLATMISSTALVMLTSTVTKVAYPQFSALFSKKDTNALAKAYHENSQIVTVLIVPTALIMAFFAKEILAVWTRDEAIAQRSSMLLTLAAIGTGINCLLWIPYFMQLAHGWTRLTFYFNIAATGILIVLLLVAVPVYGAAGGAVTLVIVNALYFLTYLWFMHSRILKGEMIKWFFVDVGLPLAAALAVVSATRFAVPESSDTSGRFIIVAAAALLSFAAAALSASLVRGRIFKYLSYRLK